MLDQTVEPENDLKNMLVEYVGEKKEPEDQGVTVEMIVDTMAEEFPEFLLALAEENWINGYTQALNDSKSISANLEVLRNDTEKLHNQ